MNKNQALGVVDAHMVPVIAERQRRLQRRQQFMLALYPALKGAPPDERAELLQEARRYAFRQWALYVTLGFVVVATTYLLREQIFGVASEISPSTLLLLIPLAFAPAAVLYAKMRGYLRLLVGVKYQGDHEATSQRAA